MRPRLLPGLLEQHDDVLHVSVKRGVERYAEEVEVEAGKSDLPRSKTKRGKKKLTSFQTLLNPDQPNPLLNDNR